MRLHAEKPQRHDAEMSPVMRGTRGSRTLVSCLGKRQGDAWPARELAGGRDSVLEWPARGL